VKLRVPWEVGVAGDGLSLFVDNCGG
jgi:hypothetical protein